MGGLLASLRWALSGVNRRAFLPAKKTAERNQARGVAFVSARVAHFVCCSRHLGNARTILGCGRKAAIAFCARRGDTPR